MTYYVGTLDKDQEVLYYGIEGKSPSKVAWHKEKEKATTWPDYAEPAKLVQKLNVQSQRFQFFLIHD